MSQVRRTSLLVVTLVSAIGVCWLAQSAWNRSASFLANTWQSELERAPESEVDGLLERICSLGDEAVPALTAALLSPREWVSRAAAKAIRRQLEQWQSLPPGVRSLRRRRLAEAVVEAWPRFAGPSRLVAAEVLRELVSSGWSGEARQDARLLAACAEVLRSVPSREPNPPGPQQAPAIRPPAVARTAAAVPNESLKTPPLVHAADSPRGSEQVGAAAGPAGSAGSAGPAPLPSEAIASRPLPAAGGGTRSLQAEEARRSDSESAAANEPRRLPDVRRASLDEPEPPRSSAADAVEPAELSQLADQLNDGDPQREAAARQRLGALGWSAKEIEVAKRLRHPEAAVRRALARCLPDVVGMDAAPWLLELSRDPDADVRLEAMTLLATTSDPALVDTVRKLAAADSDERIQKLAARLAQANASLVKEHPK